MQFLHLVVLLTGGALAQTPPGFSPATNISLTVKYDDINVSKGNLVPINKAAMSPSLGFTSMSKNASHFVVMVDLDAPNGTDSNSYAPFLHWSTFIPFGLDRLPGNASNMSDFAPYFGPAPPPGTGPHRYAVLLWSSQNKTFQVPPSFQSFNASDITSRIKFDVQRFAHEGQMELAAANWFTSENETAALTNTASRGGRIGITALIVCLIPAVLCQLIQGHSDL
ncbi:hypothetical protein FZEAL_9472 [Fusarium zealandicum]|uniref:Phosphatidylethanolamine-binding protein n=1 Tax=Fusarium zealandicum TaxID=1053134 RepID=A0A8H4UBB8_9HYPO|nr:hypothetical protein FZEAL_9472 [Fusarium zealandicum]